MKTLLYNIFKFPLILIFIKTPLIKILERRFIFKRFEKKKIFFWLILDIIFQKEYFNKLDDKNKIRELSNSTLKYGQGRKWALHYYNNHFRTIENLKKQKTGILFQNDANPIFEKIIEFIQNNNLKEIKDTTVIQLGSSSGRDLEFFLKQFPDLNYISTDINDEIINFQKEKYNYKNLKYYKCYAEDFDKCIEYFQIKNKNILLFSVGSLQYVHPYFLKVFFKKLKNFKKLNLFINEPFDLRLLDKTKNLISSNRGDISFSHIYDIYAKNSDLNVIESKIIRPYENDNVQHKFTGHFYLHLNNKV